VDSQRPVSRANPGHTRITSLLIYCVTFLSGAVFLGLEIVASRVVAPFFGNSIYVWGSLISVFLLALSVGYFIGGILADRVPDFPKHKLSFQKNGATTLLATISSPRNTAPDKNVTQ